MEWIITDEKQLKDVAIYILQRLSKTPIVLLRGDLGAGKTRLCKEIVKLLGSQDRVSSPTFSLINEYEYGDGLIYHMDMYRLEHINEALQIGITEYLDSDQICLVEWPDLILSYIKDEYLTVDIRILSGNSRKYIVQVVYDSRK